MSPQTLPLPVQLLTAEEFFARYENKHAELVRGVVKELPMPGGKHGRLCAKLTWVLMEFVEKHQLGTVFSNDTFVLVDTNPDVVYGPDVFFVSFGKLPKDQIPVGMITVIPELVAEVRSPSNAWTELLLKVDDYLAAGVKTVVLVNPDLEAVAVYRQEGETHFGLDDELTLPDVLPGFSLPVKRLFE